MSTITETKTRTIDGLSLLFTEAELKKVRHLCYWCTKCKVYHLFEGNDFGDIEAILGK